MKEDFPCNISAHPIFINLNQTNFWGFDFIVWNKISHLNLFWAEKTLLIWSIESQSLLIRSLPYILYRIAVFLPFYTYFCTQRLDFFFTDDQDLYVIPQHPCRFPQVVALSPYTHHQILRFVAGERERVVEFAEYINHYIYIHIVCVIQFDLNYLVPFSTTHFVKQ